MASILREITVDVAQLNRFQAIVAKQYDRQSRFLKVHLTNMGEEIEADQEATVVINARREDGVAKSFLGEVNNDGTVTVPLTYWMLELDGMVKCDISIIVGTESVLTTTLFELEVQEAAADEESVEADEDYGILVGLIQEVETLKTTMEDTADNLTEQYETSAVTVKNTYEAAAADLQDSYEAAAVNLKAIYEASMEQAVEDCQTAVEAAQLVTGPFYIVDNDNHKTYQAAIQVTNGKPVCVYEEFTGGNE